MRKNAAFSAFSAVRKGRWRAKIVGRKPSIFNTGGDE